MSTDRPFPAIEVYLALDEFLGRIPDADRYTADDRATVALYRARMLTRLRERYPDTEVRIHLVRDRAAAEARVAAAPTASGAAFERVKADYAHTDTEIAPTCLVRKLGAL